MEHEHGRYFRDMLQESKVPLANPIHLCRAGSAAHFMDACIWERLASGVIPARTFRGQNDSE
jgi:hypothetical protein